MRHLIIALALASFVGVARGQAVGVNCGVKCAHAPADLYAWAPNGNPHPGGQFTVATPVQTLTPPVQYFATWSFGRSPVQTPFGCTWYPAWPWYTVPMVLSASRVEMLYLYVIPADDVLIGRTLYWQVAVHHGAGTNLSNCLAVTIEPPTL